MNLSTNHGRLSVLFISSALKREFGGPPEAVVGAACALAKKGIEVKLFVFGQPKSSAVENQDFYKRLTESGVAIHRCFSIRSGVYGGFGSMVDIRQLLLAIRESDWISVHGIYKFENFLAFLFASLCKTRYSIMPHGTFTRYQRNIHRVRKIPIDFLLKYTLLKYSSAIFVATTSEKEEIMNFLQSKTKVVGLGINKNVQKIARISNETEFRFLFLGRIAPKKRIDLAIQAFAIFCARNPSGNFTLEIYGNGESDYLREMTNLAYQKGKSLPIRFHGWAEQSQKPKIFSESHCFLLTSEDENFAISVAEALGYGIPCIVSKNVALSEIIERHHAGVTFSELKADDIADCMEKIFHVPWSELSKAAELAANELLWEKVAETWEKHILEMIT